MWSVTIHTPSFHPLAEATAAWAVVVVVVKILGFRVKGLGVAYAARAYRTAGRLEAAGALDSDASANRERRRER